jgi:hypothetical protein
VLEDAGELGAALCLRFVQAVKVGQAKRRRLLGQDVDARLQAFDGLVDMEHGRRAEMNNVRFGARQQGGQREVPALNPVLAGEGVQPALVHIARGHELRPPACPGKVVRVHRGDPAGSHDGHSVRPHDLSVVAVNVVAVELSKLSRKIQKFRTQG